MNSNNNNNNNKTRKVRRFRGIKQRRNINNINKNGNNYGRRRRFRRNNIRRNFQNSSNGYNNRNDNNDKIDSLINSVKSLSLTVKKNSLGGGPFKSLNARNKKNMNDPNKINKEIRYDRLYSALNMYLMGKYYSFYKTSNMIVRISIYSTHSFTVPSNTDTCGFIWFPYFYPWLINGKVKTNDENRQVSTAANFFARVGNDVYAFSPTMTNIRGNYRLISATMKVANMTTNSQKGGCFTMYRVCRNEGQPLYYNEELGLHDDLPVQGIKEMLGFHYNNEPTKYLYNANEVALCNEYGVIEGNTMFQSYNEYMGCRTLENSTMYCIAAGSASGIIDIFNPVGVNVKYIGIIDPTSSNQTYKVECIQVFEVSPLSTDSIANLAFKGDKSVYSSVIAEAKNKFNFEVGKP